MAKRKRNHVLHGALGEIVVDAEDAGLRKRGEENSVELLGGGEVVAEGLLYDHAGAFGGSGLHEVFDDGLKERGRDGKIMGGTFCVAEFFLYSVESGRVGVVAVHIAEQPAELAPCGVIEPAVLSERSLGAIFQLVEIPSRLGHADDRNGERAALHHGLQGRGISSCRRGRRWRRRRRVRRSVGGLAWLVSSQKSV